MAAAKAGQPTLGLQDRLCLRVYDSSTEQVQIPRQTHPSNRSHDPLHMYLAAAGERERQQQWKKVSQAGLQGLLLDTSHMP